MELQLRSKQKTVAMSATHNNSGSVVTSIDISGADEASYYFASDYAVLIFQWVNYAVVCQAVDIFGTVSNIINIICFVKQGFKDPVNVSFLGLAISDLGCLVTLIYLNLSLTPVFQYADLPFNTLEVEYLTVAWPHVMFTRVSSWVTALITVERCLCITMPLKVKNMVTSKRVSVIIACLFIVLTCSISPVYCVNGLALKFDPERNKSILRLVATKDREIVEKISFAINNIFVPVTAFITVSISTIILVVELKRKTKWRSQATKESSSNAISNRDQKVAMMVVMVSILFIVCFIPVVIYFLAMMLVPEFAVDGKYRNLFLIVFGLGFTLESTNSSMNIFIYYHMSSRYRVVFRQLFHKQTLDED